MRVGIRIVYREEKVGEMDKNSNNQDVGKIIKQQRVIIPLTLRQLGAMSGISTSHLGRIERGERFPSASVLRKLAKPLGFEEGELFSLAGYLSSPPVIAEEKGTNYSSGRLDPYVRQVLGQESVEVQRAVIGILSIFKSITGVLKVDSD